MNRYVNDYFSSIPQSYTDELIHYGVLGMKWGKRKARREAIKSTSKSIQSKASKKTKRKAAKYMVDKNMSETEAVKKAKNKRRIKIGATAAVAILAGAAAKKSIGGIKNYYDTAMQHMPDMENILYNVVWEQ